MKKILSAILLSTTLFAAPALLAEMVNLNKASAAALQENLKGVGEKKALAIVKYREEFGAFKTLDEIKEVKGIGDGIFKKIKSDLSLTRGATGVAEKPSAIAVKKESKKKDKKLKGDEAASKASSSDKTQRKTTKKDKIAGNPQNS